MPHVQRATQIHQQLFSAKLHSKTAIEALNGLAVGVILTGLNGCVLFCNSAADHILRSGRGLRVQGGRLSGETPAATNLIQHTIQAVAQTSAGKGTHPGGLIPVPCASGPSLPLLVSPIRAEDPLLGQLAGPVAMLLVADPQQQRRTQQSDLARLYGLTQAEARLLTALIGGLSVAEYAESASISVNTARVHLKQVFAKTGERRQSDLIRRVLADPILSQFQEAGNG